MSLFEPRSGHILGLSDELMVLVLSLLPSSDLISVSRTCTKLLTIARDKHVIKRLDFRRDTRLTAENFKYFLAGSQTCDKIRGLNLNGVHWIQSGVIHSQLLKMKNLTELHVGDVIFTAKQFSTILQKQPLLSKLSFTWPWHTEVDINELRKADLNVSYSKLTELSIYLAVGDRYPLEALNQLLSKCENLEKLVILTEIIDVELPNLSPDRYNIVCSLIPFTLPRLKLLVMDIQNLTIPTLLMRDFCEKTFDASFNDTVKVYPNSYGVASTDFRDEDMSLKPLEKFVEDQKLNKLLLYTPAGGSTFENDLCHDVLEDIFSLNSEFFRNMKEFNLHLKDANADYVPKRSNLRTFARKLDDVQSFENLEKISMPICGFISTNKKGETSSEGLDKVLKAMRKLTHIEIKFCPEIDIRTLYHDGALIVETLAANAPHLQSLVISNVGFWINLSLNQSISDSVFPKLFKGCENLKELHISSLQTNPQKLFASLEKGLKSAKSLTVLKVYQKQFTQYSERLFVTIRDSCKQLEQIVIVDPSNSFTLRKFPVKSVIELLTSLNKIRFLYLGSGLLTIEEVKALKSATKKIMKTRPWLVARYQKRIAQSPFYSLEDVTELPMEFQRSVATLDIRREYQWTQSEVAIASVNQYF